jgi:hypothetical protein
MGRVAMSVMAGLVPATPLNEARRRHTSGFLGSALVIRVAGTSPAMTGRVFCVRRRSLVGSAGVAAAAAEPTAETAKAAEATQRPDRAE